MQKLNRVLEIFDFEVEPLTQEEDSLIAKREEARADGRWTEADDLRERLRQRNILVVDTPIGTRWERMGKFDNPK